MTTSHSRLDTGLSSFSPPRLSRRECLGWASAALAAPLLPACGGGSGGSSDPASVRWCRDAIRSALERSHSTTTTAVSVALLADDRVVWREAFGYADRERGVAATTETRFNIGSVSKVVSTLAVMILRDRGQLALDQPLVELLPGFRMLSPNFRRVTVRHLLSHASGFPGNNMLDNGTFAPYLGYADATLKALAGSDLKHEPGELAVYCNDGFTLIEPLVRAVSGRPFTEFVQREIFEPLGMDLSGYPVAAAAEGSYVHPYFGGRGLPQEMSTPFATGGIFSTPSDMMKFAQLLMDQGVCQGRRIVSAEAVREMGVDQSVRTRINPAAASWRWGLGWDSVRQAGLDAAGLRAWTKNGGTFFFSSEFFVLPEARLAMLITGSGHDYEAQKLAEGLLLRVAEERRAIQAQPRAIVPVVPPLAVPAPDGAALAGVYASSKAPLKVGVADDGSLVLHRWNGAGWDTVHDRLRARGDGHWWADGRPTVGYRFQTVDGHRYLIRRELAASALNWGDAPLGEWLPPLDTPLPAAWTERLGSQWRFANDSPDALTRLFAPIVWRLDVLPDLPGYVFLEDQLLRVVDGNEAGMTVKVPGDVGRDLYEIRMVKAVDAHGVQTETLRLGNVVFERFLPKT